MYICENTKEILCFVKEKISFLPLKVTENKRYLWTEELVVEDYIVKIRASFAELTGEKVILQMDHFTLKRSGADTFDFAAKFEKKDFRELNEDSVRCCYAEKMKGVNCKVTVDRKNLCLDEWQTEEMGLQELQVF